METRRRKKSQQKEVASRWNTPEFYFYYACILGLAVYIIPRIVSFSSPDNPSYFRFAHRLQDGWLFGRKVDNSDKQYAGFRDKIPILTFVMGVYLSFSWLIKRYLSDKQEWKLFSFAFSVLFLLVLHGLSVLKMLAIISLNYVVVKYALKPGKFMPLFTWGLGLAVLFLNDIYQGYYFSNLSQSLAFLDEWRGLLPRWHVHFNLCVLRMISFTMDYNWSNVVNRMEITEKMRHCKDCLKQGDSCERHRMEMPLRDKDYSFFNYITYCWYVPLYIAGPIVSFNWFMSQVEQPPKKLSVKNSAQYGLRLLGAVLLMELMMHYIWVVAMSKEKVWDTFDVTQLAMYAYFNLKFIWLKLMIIWRFFRFWALCDGIDSPENMARCMSNNYSPAGFWREWHRSFYKWILRYMYIPLGGKHTRLWNSFLIFSFVAIWHDIELRLLLWGWLIPLFIIPEILFEIAARKYLGHLSFYRHLAAVGGSVNVLLMIMLNLIGFTDGSLGLAKKYLQPEYASFFASIVLIIFVFVQIMFEIREDERRRETKENQE